MPPHHEGLGKTVSLDLFDMPGDKKRHKLEKYSDPRVITLDALESSGLFRLATAQAGD